MLKGVGLNNKCLRQLGRTPVAFIAHARFVPRTNRASFDSMPPSRQPQNIGRHSRHSWSMPDQPGLSCTLNYYLRLTPRRTSPFSIQCFTEIVVLQRLRASLVDYAISGHVLSVLSGASGKSTLAATPSQTRGACLVNVSAGIPYATPVRLDQYHHRVWGTAAVEAVLGCLLAEDLATSLSIARM